MPLPVPRSARAVIAPRSTALVAGRHGHGDEFRVQNNPTPVKASMLAACNMRMSMPRSSVFFSFVFFSNYYLRTACYVIVAAILNVDLLTSLLSAHVSFDTISEWIRNITMPGPDTRSAGTLTCKCLLFERPLVRTA